MGLCGSSEATEAPSGNSDFKKSSDYYVEHATLGRGASCTVVIAAEKKTGKRFAMKKLKKPSAGDKDSEDNEYLFNNEAKVLREVKHPNIVEFVEAFEDQEYYHLLTALCTGGELFDRVSAGSFSERDASVLAKQMLTGLGHCHSKNIVHRDLKPENYVFETKDVKSNMRLIDFGCALQVQDNEPISDVAGSPYYVAPEVLSAVYTRTGKVWKASDMWSIGVIVYLLVHGYPPFNAQSQKGIFTKIKAGRYRFGKDLNLSDEVKDFIRHLLLKNPDKRMTARQALNHKWIKNVENVSSEPLPASVVSSLLDFSSQCKLKKAVGKLVANQMSDADRTNLQELFQKFDKNGDGQLGPEEIVEMLKHIGRPAADVGKIMEEFDDDGDGAIQFEEFANAMGAGQMDDEKQAAALFKQLDTDGSGELDIDELIKAMKLTPAEAKQMVAEVDANGDGVIDFQEWIAAMGTRQKKK